MELNKIYQGNALKVLKTFPDECINCCVTSPPYYGLRDYGLPPIQWSSISYKILGFNIDIPAWCGQLGLEPNPEMYMGHIIEIFREVKRVLKKEGVCWLNLGDSYAGSGKASGQKPEHKNCGKIKQKRGYDVPKPTPSKEIGLKPKDLIGIPWMVAFALRADGWYLRQDIIWNKPNPMPESVTDRCTKSHEYIFLLTKSAKYYYDAKAIATPYADKTYTTFGTKPKGYGDGSGLIKSENWNNSIVERKPKQWKTPDGWDTAKGSHGTIHRKGREKGFKGYEHRRSGDKTLTDHLGNYDKNGNLIGTGFANKRSVWTVSTQSFPEAHFATFPELLIVDCIKAGCPENGIVLDPFIGAGTTGLVSRKLNRNYIGIELGPKYVKMGDKRIYNEIGLFL